MGRGRRLAQGAFLFASLSILTRCGARTALEPGELVPMCAGLVVQDVRFGTVKQMDLLFMIDNSLSMADKQDLLRDAIPPLVRRLANPLCVNATNADEQVAVSSPGAPCPDGFVREFEPLQDLHIGVITSSIGSAGGLECGNREAQNDFGRLLGSRPRAASVPTYEAQGFLDWDPARQHLPPGEADIEELERNFASLVTLAGEGGCGLEASLESWYRFLIDPAPAEHYPVKNNLTVPEGIDRTVLAQRAQFLRPDSSVAIVMLSDENDCSIMASGQGWLVGTTVLGGGSFRLSPSTSACANDPNSPCCVSCANGTTPPGCLELAKDSECSRPNTNDSLNLRCFEQKRRFGFDLLYPTSRYAVGLANRMLCPASIYQDADCACTFVRERARRLGRPEPPCGPRETGTPVKNPLYDNLSSEVAFDRDPSQVILAGILGVPWQDIATPETLVDPARLEYLPAAKLGEKDPKLGFDRWQLILGDPISATRPLDPFMHESIEPRSGTNPLTEDAIVPASSTNPLANPINGHEHPTDAGDLQYACTFRLAVPRACTDDSNNILCDCGQSSSATDPLCQDPDGRGREKMQFFAKAYPGLRQLDVLRQVGSNAVVASICPKALVGASNAEVEFGYRPAVAGIVGRLRCSSLDARFDEDRASPDFGTVNCRLVGLRENVTPCDCNGSTRRWLGEDDALALRLKLHAAQLCGPNVGRSCEDFCACEIPQTRGSALTACQNDADQTPLDPATSTPVDGWCYIDPGGGFGSKELVQACPAGSARDLRLLGAGAPQSGERLLAICGNSCDSASE